MSHTSLTYHLIFGTYRRLETINTDHERELYKYMYDFAVERGVHVRRIGGMADHVHILCDIPARMAVADFVKLLKSESSKFMRVNPHFPTWRGWAEGYGAFTVEASKRATRVKYIMNQKEHHAKVSFVDEYRSFLIENGLSPATNMLGDNL